MNTPSLVRDRWTKTADLWLSGIRRHGAENPAGVVLPGRITRDGVVRESMETICRSFLLASARIRGAEPEDAEADTLIAFYAQAISDGTNPDHPAAWPLGVTCRTPLTGVTNSIVEGANLAWSLFIAGDRFWNALGSEAQERIFAWLRHHARREVWGNNWQLFPAMAEAFLRYRGADVTGLTGYRRVARVEGWYLENGWYTDGPEHAIDYYNAWAIHPYLWAWYQMTHTEDSPQRREHMRRLSEFVEGFADFVAADGALVHFGRSLTYRTAALGALWCAEISGVNPLSPARTRQLATSVLDNFVAHGVGANGQLSLGWYDEFLPSMQDYSGFGSPYLAGIGFTGLALPASADVWTAPEEERENTAFTRNLGAAGITLSSAGGELDDAGVAAPVILINHGSDHGELPVDDHGIRDVDDPHYHSFAYSTHSAPEVGLGFIAAIDGHISLFDAHDRASRRVKLRGQIADGHLSASLHYPQIGGALLPASAITTASIVHRGIEVRAHLVQAPLEFDRVREGSFALAGASDLARSVTENQAIVSNDTHRAVVTAVSGWDETDTVAHRGTNAMGTHSAIGVLHAKRSETETVHVAVHQLVRLSDDADVARESLRVEVSGTRVLVEWPGEDVRVDVDLATLIPGDGQPRRG